MAEEKLKTEICAALEAAGIDNLIFVRHANAAPPGSKAKTSYDTPHDWQRDDQMRPLTDKGKAQAEDARRWFLQHIKLENCKILCASGARRATETLEVMASTRTEIGANVTIQMVAGLHPAGMAPRCEELFDTLNYGPLTKFWAQPGGEEAFKGYADQVLEEFTSVVYGIPAGKPGNTIALFGHAVFHNAVAWRMASFWGLDAESLQDLLELELGEAEGLWITKTPAGTTVRHLHTKALAPVGISAHPLF